MIALWRRLDGSGRHWLSGVLTGLGAVVTIGSVAALAIVFAEPLLFPSLGPTVYLLFAAPLKPNSCPRNTVLGHLIGIVAGYLALLAFGLAHTPPDLEHVSWARAGAAVLAIGLTCAVMQITDLPHPPAGATTLIVALGLLRTPHQLAIVMLGVALITLVGLIINRATGFDYPLWRPRT